MTDRRRTARRQGVFDATVREGVLRLRRRGTRWLSTGHAGGASEGPVAYNVTVPEGWAETDLEAYVARRRERAGFATTGPTLLTGVDQGHARRARLDGVEAVVTAGVSNPAALAMPDDLASETPPSTGPTPSDAAGPDSPDGHAGTINVFVGTDRALAPGALANLLTVAAEAKAATLVASTGFTGTTTDAVVAACDPDGDPAKFTGSATPVGRAARACVRDALLAGLASRYDGEAIPASVDEADYGVVTDAEAAVSSLE